MSWPVEVCYRLSSCWLQHGPLSLTLSLVSAQLCKLRQGISAMRMGHCISFPMRVVHCAHGDPFLPGLRSKSSFTLPGFVTRVEAPLVLNRTLRCSLASSAGKSPDIGFIILFTSLPALLTRIMLRYRKRMTSEKAGGEERRSKGSTRNSARGSRGSRSSRAKHGSSLQICSFSTRTKPFKCTL